MKYENNISEQIEETNLIRPFNNNDWNRVNPEQMSDQFVLVNGETEIPLYAKTDGRGDIVAYSTDKKGSNVVADVVDGKIVKREYVDGNIKIFDYFSKAKDIDDAYNNVHKDSLGSIFKPQNTPQLYFGEIINNNTDSNGVRLGDRVKSVKDRINKSIKQKHLDATGHENVMQDDFDTNEIIDILNNGGIELDVNGKTFAYGNKKLPEDIMIVNLTATFTCPSAQNGECEIHNMGKCYSKNSEKGIKIY